MANLNYQLGPLIWQPAYIPPEGSSDRPIPFGYWRAPDGCIGMVDLGSLPQCAQASGDHRPLAFMCSTVPLGSGYDLLGTGDCREITTTIKMKTAWKSLTGYQPQGDRLVDLLADHLLNGADPHGLNACPPLVPTAGCDLEIHLAGHSRIWNQKFKWGVSKHTNQLKSLLKKDAKKVKDKVKSQSDLEHYQKILGAWELKYGVDVAKDIDPDTPKKKPSTAYTDTFPVDKSGNWDGTGEDIAWTKTSHGNGNSRIAGSVVISNYLNTSCYWRTSSALSAADHYLDIEFNKLGYAGSYQSNVVCLARTSSSSLTTYYSYAVNSANTWVSGKNINGTGTEFGTNSTAATSDGIRMRLSANGSSIARSRYASGAWSTQDTTTDTAISGNLYTGFGTFMAAYAYAYFGVNTFWAEDIITGPAIPVLMQQYRRRS